MKIRMTNEENLIHYALGDIEGRHALLMCLQQLGEALGKIENPEWRKNLNRQQARTMRNIPLLIILPQIRKFII